MFLTEQAALIATCAHTNAFRRDGAPYIAHPAAVARRITDLGHPTQVIAVAWLHDVVEDTETTLADLEEIGFPSVVVDAVEAMTIRMGENYFTAVRRAAANPISRVVKLADTEHNSRPDQLTCFSAEDRSRKTAKYAQAQRILLAA